MTTILTSAAIILSASCALAQPAPPALEFEVADVKVSKSTAVERTENFTPAGRFVVTNSTLYELLPFAYRRKASSIVAPAWFKSDRFDIVAKAPPGTKELDLGLMLRSLLVREFKIAWHEEQRPASVYSMTVATGGPKFPKSAILGPPLCKRGQGSVDCTNLAMNELAARLGFFAPDYIDRVVINSTELPGSYDLHLTWVPSNKVDDLGGLTIFAAMEKQLGLRLKKAELPLATVIVDSAERPARN